ncbi:hypothetical protein CVT26_010058 [Gymnopilus dilepis]|uniref:Uncharacterized protein n=1 Tax=Gymnopilus dilepis TaxID=231916 RepID=A0A409VWM7_9AGAR|nr:hypothetical protein CVT26_010058 [Gymnopilus dilepis]
MITCLDLFLQQLNRYSTHQWHLAVWPNPFKYRPTLVRFLGYEMKSDLSPDDPDNRRPKKLVEHLYSQNDLLIYSSNICPHRRPMKYKNREDQDLRWALFGDVKSTTGDGYKLRHAITEILQKFPTYDLQSEEGIKQASSDIKSHLQDISVCTWPRSR